MVKASHDFRRNYLTGVLNVHPNDVNSYIAVMDKYGNECWWDSDDPIKIAKFQVQESVLLVPFIKFQDALEIVLKRPVSSSEISFENAALRAEVIAATA